MRIPRDLLAISRASVFAAALALLFAFAAHPAARAQQKPPRAQSFNKDDIKRGREILKIIKSEIEDNYYDKTFRGVDLKAHFKEADEMIKNADSNGQIFGIIARALLFLDDSHTYFVPPGRLLHVDYGWQVQMIGDRCHLVSVRPGSDAERKGLRPGDTVHFVDGMKPTREDLWKIRYLYGALRPQTQVKLVVESPGGAAREVEVLAKVHEPGKGDLWNAVLGGKYSSEAESDEEETEDAEATGKREEGKAEEREKKKQQRKRSTFDAHVLREVGDNVLVWKMPRFNLSKDEVDEIMKRVNSYKALILDLRNNGGGYETTLLRMLGHFFERDVKVGDLVRRKGKKELFAKSLGDKVFKGQLVVLVDSNSGSASEVLARVVQLEKRGTVLGDRTAGAVMRGRRAIYPVADERLTEVKVSFFSLTVTDADIVMMDGRSLERTGVVPDELLLPTAEDLAGRRDPLMSRAAALLGVKLDAAKAGALLPRSVN